MPYLLTAGLPASLVLAAGPTDAAAKSKAKGFTGDVCDLLMGSEATAVHGVPSRCPKTPPGIGPGSKIYTANWASKDTHGPTLGVTVSVYTEEGPFALAKRNLAEGLPSSRYHKLEIGDAAYEASGAGTTGIHFVVGKDVVVVLANDPGNPSPAAGPLESLAKAIAGRL